MVGKETREIAQNKGKAMFDEKVMFRCDAKKLVARLQAAIAEYPDMQHLSVEIDGNCNHGNGSMLLQVVDADYNEKDIGVVAIGDFANCPK